MSGAGAGTYRFREDVAIADVAFEARAPSLEALFAAAAEATLATMVERPESVEPKAERRIALEEERADLLLLRFLEELVYFKDADGILLRVPLVRIVPRDGRLALEASAVGEPIDPARHALRSDVKAVTLHRLRVERSAEGWEAFVILDV